ncbi:hypothetical protein BJ742DRAFT_746147 [Cladochytrium replicatum]|nr:hypothetical protein BJ742DRAFT_746147 [Cladochytrium replicatum]
MSDQKTNKIRLHEIHTSSLENRGFRGSLAIIHQRLFWFSRHRLSTAALIVEGKRPTKRKKGAKLRSFPLGISGGEQFAAGRVNRVVGLVWRRTNPIAQSRDGAEKLVESKLIEVLTDCQFVDQKPDSDNTLIFLDGLVRLARTNAVVLVEDREQTTTLTNLRVLNLVAVLISYLASSNRELMENVWIGKVVPVTDEEAQEDSSIGLYGKTLFKQEALGIAQDICKHALVYCRGITDASKPPIIFFFDSTKETSSAAMALASSLPTLHSMAAYAKAIGNELVMAIDQHATFTGRYSDVNKLPIEDINEIVSTLDIPTEDLSTFQRQQCAAKELLRLSTDSLKGALSGFSKVHNPFVILEHVHLLIRRHLEVFSKFGTAEGFVETQGWNSSSEHLQTLHMDVLAALNPTLGRVATLEFQPQMVGSDGSGLQFLKMLLRRLRMLDISIER